MIRNPVASSLRERAAQNGPDAPAFVQAAAEIERLEGRVASLSHSLVAGADEHSHQCAACALPYTPSGQNEDCPRCGCDGEQLPTEPLLFIWSGQHGAYWRFAGCGYTMNRSEAGLWPESLARARANHCGPEKLIELRPLIAG